jgi:hypothetical protein
METVEFKVVVPLTPKVFKLEFPVTFKVLMLAVEETVSDWPIPTLPETFMEDPTPKNPEK